MFHVVPTLNAALKVVAGVDGLVVEGAETVQMGTLSKQYLD